MQHGRSLRRSALLVLSLLSACAAAQPGDPDYVASGPVRITTTSGAQLIARVPAGQYYKPLGGAWTKK